MDCDTHSKTLPDLVRSLCPLPNV